MPPSSDPRVRVPFTGTSFSVTLEPMILMFNLGNSLFSGAKQTQNLMHRRLNN